MWGYQNMGWGMWWGMGLGTLILLVLIALLVWAIARGGRAVPAPSSAAPRPDALQVLDERLARGEIEPDDYNQRRRLLIEQH